MSTLLLRLAAPLQSWGVEAKFETRRTQNYPTKSGVIGLLAAALGYSRDSSLERLNGLFFGVRVDRRGELLRDYHIVETKTNLGPSTIITERFYLADAIFLAGLESDDVAFLQELEQALHNPVFPLYLGRRSCAPTMPLSLGVRDSSLIDTLRNEPPQANSERKLWIITDAQGSDVSALIQDNPVSFDRIHRKFAFRPVKERYIDMSLPTQHDPMNELGNGVI